MDPELYERIYEMYNDGNFHSHGEKAARPVWDTMKRLSRRDMDDRDEFVTSFMGARINHEL